MSQSSDLEEMSSQERKRSRRYSTSSASTKRSRRRSTSSASTSSNEGAIDLPLTLTWTKVDKSKSSSGEKMCPSGTPRLTEDYRDEMEQIEKDRAIKKAEKKDGTLKELEENCEDQKIKTLTVCFSSMKKNFKDVEEWWTGRCQPPRPSRGSITVVEKWPEPQFLDESANKSENDDMTTESALNGGVTGTASAKEKKRWHHRSRYEAVYERQFDNFDREKESKRRMLERSRPINANMEAIGQRVKSEPGQPRESMQPTSMDRNSRESFQRTPQRSPSREQRDSRSERKEVEHRRYDERRALQPISMDRNSRESFQRTPRRSPSREHRDSRSERKEVEHRRYDEREDARENGYSNERGDTRPRESMQPTSMDRNSRESFQRTPRRSPSREQRDSRSERKEVEHRRYDERGDARENGYRNERNGNDECVKREYVKRDY